MKFLFTLFFLLSFFINVKSQNITEIHYDNVGGDVGEFIEVYIASATSATDVSSYKLTLYNGLGGGTYSPTSITLDNASIAKSCDSPGPGCYYVWSPSSIQNGSPDGVALDMSGTVLEFLSYEGSFTATSGVANMLVSTEIGSSEDENTPIGTSMQKQPDGSWVAELVETPGAMNILPVDLKEFSILKNDNGVISKWSTIVEINNDFFTIQHSIDGKKYTDIGKVNGSGTSSSEKEYTFTHRNPANGVNYYRLKQTDYNGQYEIFPAKSIYFNRNINKPTIFPNVSNDIVNINFSKEVSADFLVYSIDGRRLLSGSFKNQENQLDISGLEPGQYIVQINSGSEIATERIIKE